MILKTYVLAASGLGNLEPFGDNLVAIPSKLRDVVADDKASTQKMEYSGRNILQYSRASCV